MAIALEPAKLTRTKIGIGYQTCDIEIVGNSISVVCHDARNAKVFGIGESWKAMDFVEDYLTEAAKTVPWDRLELRNWLRENFERLGLR